MDFDTLIDRRNTHSIKWDMMETLYGVDGKDGLAMWVADMDFKAPEIVNKACQRMYEHGVYGYYGDMTSYWQAIIWWMENRFGWRVESDWIFTTHGLVNGMALCVETFTRPDDGVILFTPVYHSFARILKAGERRIQECPLKYESGRYTYDFAAYDAMLRGDEKMIILCSPQNPGGQVWSREELQGVADFAKRHDLLIVSDEIHADLVFGGKTHIPMALVDESIQERLIMMTAASKTFNIPGAHTGNVIIPDPSLRARYAKRSEALGISPNSFGLTMVEAAYSPEGVAWLEAVLKYIGENKAIFDAAINGVPGLKSMALEATYLAWVDFSDTGMAAKEFIGRIEKRAKIAASHGATFGSGGENFLRFNLATQRTRLIEATTRIGEAFSDLQ